MAKPKRTSTSGALTKMLTGKRIPQYVSVSAYLSYAECPAAYAYNRVIQYCLSCGSTRGKRNVGGSKRCIACGEGGKSIPAIERGIMIHSKAEAYLRGQTSGLPSELEEFSTEFAALTRRKAKPEVSWTITRDGRTCLPTDWELAWLRVKIDAHDYDKKERHLTVIDYKTGQEKPQTEQGEVYCWVAQYYYPELKTVNAEFWWTNSGNVTTTPKTGVFTRRDLTKLESKWRERFDKMLADKTFVATPGNHCGKCYYRSSKVTNGLPGPCDAWKAVL